MRPHASMGSILYALVVVGLACGGNKTGSRHPFSSASLPRTASPEKVVAGVTRSAVGSEKRSKDLGPRKLSLERWYSSEDYIDAEPAWYG